MAEKKQKKSTLEFNSHLDIDNEGNFNYELKAKGNIVDAVLLFGEIIEKRSKQHEEMNPFIFTPPPSFKDNEE